MYITPRYDPVFVEPNLKEYETQVNGSVVPTLKLGCCYVYSVLTGRLFDLWQVLQMSVPIDDSDSYNDLQIDFSRKNHTFNLDNVGYISKESGNNDTLG